MRLSPLFAAAALAICAASSARAGQDCGDPATQADLDACSARAYEAADQALNATYGEIARRLSDDPDARGLLTRAERAWIAYRDAECAFQTSGAAGGSIQPMLVAICLEKLTAARNADLGAYLHCEEGDPGCPVPPAE